MTFLIGLVLAAIASFVTYASVMGIGSMFASTATPVMLAWTAVELGKYAAMSYSYRNWRQMDEMLRIVMGGFIVFIMLLTSAGVYAYLGQSYTQVATSVSKNEVAIKSVASQLEQTRSRLAAIDKQVGEIPNTSTTARIRLIQQYDDERKPLAARQTTLEADLAKLTTGNIEAETHVGIIKFLADSFGVSVERATMLAILALTLCLDPFAMALNVLLQRLLLESKAKRDAQVFRNRQSRKARSDEAQESYDQWMIQYKPDDPRTKKIRERRGLWSNEEIRDKKIELEVESTRAQDQYIRDRKTAGNVNPPADYAKPPMPPGPEQYEQLQYEKSVEQGFIGTFQDWKASLKDRKLDDDSNSQVISNVADTLSRTEPPRAPTTVHELATSLTDVNRVKPEFNEKT